MRAQIGEPAIDLGEKRDLLLHLMEVAFIAIRGIGEHPVDSPSYLAEFARVVGEGFHNVPRYIADPKKLDSFSLRYLRIGFQGYEDQAGPLAELAKEVCASIDHALRSFQVEPDVDKDC